MPLFGTPPKPKGITKEELSFIRGELMAAPFGHAEQKLNQRQVGHLARGAQQTAEPPHDGPHVEVPLVGCGEL